MRLRSIECEQAASSSYQRRNRESLQLQRPALFDSASSGDIVAGTSTPLGGARLSLEVQIKLLNALTLTFRRDAPTALPVRLALGEIGDSSVFVRPICHERQIPATLLTNDGRTVRPGPKQRWILGFSAEAAWKLTQTALSVLSGSLDGRYCTVACSCLPQNDCRLTTAAPAVATMLGARSQAPGAPSAGTALG